MHLHMQLPGTQAAAIFIVVDCASQEIGALYLRDEPRGIEMLNS